MRRPAPAVVYLRTTTTRGRYEASETKREWAFGCTLCQRVFRSRPFPALGNLVGFESAAEAGNEARTHLSETHAVSIAPTRREAHR